MNDYRPLTTEEIEVLKHNDCWAEDWTSVNVSEDFKPNFMHRVMLYGEINIGSFNKNVEVSQGFVKHSGINNATLRNVTIGDDCLIENVGNFINNYTIGDDCYISNISTLETTEGATYDEGNLVSVLNEVGEGNVILFSDLNSQLAAFMVKHFPDKEMKEKIRQLIKTDIDNKMPDRGQIGNNVKIINNSEMKNILNRSDNYSKAVCDISIPYETDLEKLESELPKLLESIYKAHEGYYEKSSCVCRSAGIAGFRSIAPVRSGSLGEKYLFRHAYSESRSAAGISEVGRGVPLPAAGCA